MYVVAMYYMVAMYVVTHHANWRMLSSAWDGTSAEDRHETSEQDEAVAEKIA